MANGRLNFKGKLVGYLYHSYRELECDSFLLRPVVVSLPLVYKKMCNDYGKEGNFVIYQRNSGQSGYSTMALQFPPIRSTILFDLVVHHTTRPIIYLGS